MTWSIDFSVKSRKELERLHIVDQRRIYNFQLNRAAVHPDPRALAKRLSGQDEELWRFRVGDYRIIVRFFDHKLEILVVELGHRREVYR